MPFFRISKVKGGPALGAVEADDEGAAFDVFAMKCGFSDFDDLAASMEVSAAKARDGLRISAIATPAPGAHPKPVPEMEVL